MSFTPAVPIGGYAGWTLLQRTLVQQTSALAESPEVARDTAYFREKIGAVTTAEGLVADPRLLRVALGAFGLGDDMANRYFITRVLGDGTLDATDLANRLSDKRYLELSRSFGFGDYAVPSTQLSDFADGICAAYIEREFESALDNTAPELRLALNAQRELAALAAKTSSDDTKWYTVLGNEPLLQVFQTAFGLGNVFGSLDVDHQLSTLKAKAETYLGSADFGQFETGAASEALIRLYLLRNQTAEGGAFSAAGTALSLLRGGGSAANLLSLL